MNLDKITKLKFAVNNGSLSEFLQGIGMYENKNNLSNLGPVDVLGNIDLIYSSYGIIPGIEYEFESTLLFVINKKTPDSLYLGLRYLLYIFDREANGKSTFKISTKNISNALYSSYVFNKDLLSKMTEIKRLNVRGCSANGRVILETVKNKIDKLNSFSLSYYKKALL